MAHSHPTDFDPTDDWAGHDPICPDAGPGGRYEIVACGDGWTRRVPVPDPTYAKGPRYNIDVRLDKNNRGGHWRRYSAAQGPLTWAAVREAHAWLLSLHTHAVRVVALRPVSS